jgi:hypothetical protein
MQVAKLMTHVYGPYKRSTDAGLMWLRLKWHERRCPFNDDQGELFPLPRTKEPRSKTWGRRRERMEWAIKYLADGYTLRTGKYVLDVGFCRPKRIVRLAERVVLEVYEIAAEMGVALTVAGEIDWRATELTPEDFYAA